jgi:hypothetical protein
MSALLQARNGEGARTILPSEWTVQKAIVDGADEGALAAVTVSEKGDDRRRCLGKKRADVSEAELSLEAMGTRSGSGDRKTGGVGCIASASLCACGTFIGSVAIPTSQIAQ